MSSLWVFLSLLGGGELGGGIGGIGPVYQPEIVWDSVGDAAIRRTDPEADDPLDETQHRAPDIIHWRIGRYSPAAPAANLFTGNWSAGGEFFRFDLTLAGLMNPPGHVRTGLSSYAPYEFGPNPVFGYIEFDIDGDVQTGGETGFPQERFLANVSRFGGYLGIERYSDRVATCGSQADAPFNEPPYVQRSGEEFHLAFRGDHVDEAHIVSGDGDAIFEAGETWLVTGRFFHRAHGYEEFSVADGPPPGAYLPSVTLRFQHVPQTNQTVISLVYPLTEAASAAHRAEAKVEFLDGSTDNQNSIVEALDDLVFTTWLFPPGHPIRDDTEFPIIADWEYKSAADFLNPQNWDVTMLLGMAYPAEPPAERFAWTDVHPEPRPGDMDGDQALTPTDASLIQSFINFNNGVVGGDDGGDEDNEVDLPNYGPNFCMHDVNYDGIVSSLDSCFGTLLGDMDADCDLDMTDLSYFVEALVNPESGSLPGSLSTLTARADFNFDQRIDGDDVQGFVDAIFAEP